MIKNKQHIKHLSQEILNHLNVIQNLVEDNLSIKNAVMSARCIIECIVDEVDNKSG